jgi:hypothetical protein
MMQMLQAGGMAVLTDGTRQADENNPKGYFEYEKVKQLNRNTTWLEEAEGKAIKIIYSLLYALPSNREYKIIFMKRQMDEILASQRAMLQYLGQRGSPVDDRAMITIFAQQLARAERWLVGQPHMTTIPIDYNATVRQPAETAVAVARFLNLPLAADEMAAAVDGHLYRQRV